MLYKFKSKAAGNVIMTAPVGDRLMRLMGREPAIKGIFLPEQMPPLVALLIAAMADDDARRQALLAEAEAEGRPLPLMEGISLRQRAWPLVDMMKRAHAEGHEIVWGV
ncbi:MAG: DUF1840 domain-containing protein [Leptothrix ochracea]|uniref:DUF1840 domain-containing protein n=1 Tax=Leptothrix ochracea TaxID=735331 RepID=UPI0034E231CA